MGIRLTMLGAGLVALALVAAASGLQPLAEVAGTTGRAPGGLIAGGLTDALPGRGAAVLFVLVSVAAAVYMAAGVRQLVGRLQRFRGLPPPIAVIAPIAIGRVINASARLARGTLSAIAHRPALSALGSWALAVLAIIIAAPR